MFFFAYFLFVLLWLIVLFSTGFDKFLEKRKNKLVLFPDNGQRIKLNLNTEIWDTIHSRERIECTGKSLKPCQVNRDFQCFNCKQVLASCVHFEKDTTVMESDGKDFNKKAFVIPKNKSANDGYCLRLTDKRARKCTQKYGGMWILAQDSDPYVKEYGRDEKSSYSHHYAYVCLCTRPNVFSRSSFYGDCDNFMGCQEVDLRPGMLNPTMKKVLGHKESGLHRIKNADWTHINSIVCNCKSSYVSQHIFDKATSPPQCVRKSIFKDFNIFSFHALETKYISVDYLKGRARAGLVKLPNPCAYDAITGEAIPVSKNPGIRLSESGVAYCHPGADGYAVVTFNSDYLANNDGKYPNAVIRVSLSPALPGTLFEVATVRRHGNKNDSFYPPFVGHRYMVNNFLVKLPYLDKDSNNMGGWGKQSYKFAASVKREYIGRAKIYVYSPELPEDVVAKLYMVGDMVQFVPVLKNKLDTDYNDFFGTIGFQNVPMFNTSTMVHFMRLHDVGFGPHVFPQFDTPSQDLDGESEWKRVNSYDEKAKKHYHMPPIYRVGKTVKLSWRTDTFTGIILTVNDEHNVLKTKNISPGDKILRNMYREQIIPFSGGDEDNTGEKFPWSSRPIGYREIGDKRETVDKIIVDPISESLILARNDAYAGENSFGWDCDGVSMVKPSLGRYICTPEKFVWPTKY